MTDENDNIPTFVEHTFSFEVYESAAKVTYFFALGITRDVGEIRIELFRVFLTIKGTVPRVLLSNFAHDSNPYSYA